MADIDHEIAAIIRTSIRNNRACSVTGLLLVHESYFVQALEGPAEAVLSTYSRIVADPRHDAPAVISAGPSGRREFGDWNMCARRFAPGDDAILDAIAMRKAFEPARLNPRTALRLLKAVRAIQERSRLFA
jgi:hypothetical protein